MRNKVAFISPAKSSVGCEEERIANRLNVSLPALTILGSLKRAGFETHFMDVAADGFNKRQPLNSEIIRIGLEDQDVVEWVASKKPDAILITSMFTFEQTIVDKLVNALKRSLPKIPVILGGIHATLKPAWHFEQSPADFIVLGEGEETITKLLSEIQGETPDIENLRGITYRQRDGKIRMNGNSERLTNINLPFAFEEVLLKDGTYRYKDKATRRNPLYATGTLEDANSSVLYGSRGCPINCNYCASTMKDGVQIRHMGSERMFADLHLMNAQFNVTVFYNQSDTFGFHKEDILFLQKVAALRKTKPEIVINNPNAFFVRTFFPKETNYELNTQLLELLKAAGLNVLTLAIDGLNPKYNKKIDFSKINLEKIIELLNYASFLGIKTEIYTIIGFPNQDKREILDDIEKMEKVRIHADKVCWQSFVLLPGTQYYQELIATSEAAETRYREHIKNGAGLLGFHAPDELNLSKVSTTEIRHILNDLRR